MRHLTLPRQTLLGLPTHSSVFCPLVLNSEAQSKYCITCKSYSNPVLTDEKYWKKKRKRKRKKSPTCMAPFDLWFIDVRNEIFIKTDCCFTLICHVFNSCFNTLIKLTPLIIIFLKYQKYLRHYEKKAKRKKSESERWDTFDMKIVGGISWRKRLSTYTSADIIQYSVASANSLMPLKKDISDLTWDPEYIGNIKVSFSWIRLRPNDTINSMDKLREQVEVCTHFKRGQLDLLFWALESGFSEAVQRELEH